MQTTGRLIVALGLLVAAASGCQPGDRAPAAEAVEAGAETPPAAETVLPEGWAIRPDRADADPAAIDFRVMEPGFHVTTGPAAIVYNPALSIDGAFRAHATFIQMTPTQHGEAYGIFVGGKKLSGGDQAYVYFLIREKGEYLIKRRSGAETATIQPWTAHPAIAVTFAEGGSNPMTLAVEASAKEVRFLVNGEAVATRPRGRGAGELDVDGVFGLRVNHRLDLHVSEFGVVPAGAPTG